jgi:hypothetical protein
VRRGVCTLTLPWLEATGPDRFNSGSGRGPSGRVCLGFAGFGLSLSCYRIFVVPRTVETRRLKPTVRLTLLNSGLSHADIYSTKGMLNGCFPPVQMAALLSVLLLSLSG